MCMPSLADLLRTSGELYTDPLPHRAVTFDPTVCRLTSSGIELMRSYESVVHDLKEAKLGDTEIMLSNYGSRRRTSSPMRINQEGQFYARLLSRESSSASRLVCHEVVGMPGSVPFGWESRPGTPIAGGRTVGGAGTFLPSLRPPPSSFRQREERGANVADGKKKGKRKPSGLRAVTARVLGLRSDWESSEFSSSAGWTSWSDDRSSFPSSCGASSLFCLGVRRHPRCGLLDEEKSTESGSR